MTIADVTLPADDSAFHVEAHGIDYIPDSERWARPRDLFGMWAGCSFQFEYLVYGAVLMTFGFTFAQAVILVLLGNLSYLLLGVCSLQGPDAGTTVFIISRASFGSRGSRLVALFNWLTQVGFETEGLILIVLAGIALAAKAGFHAGTPLKVVLIVAAAAIQMILPFLGHATLVKVLRGLVVPFVVLYVILAALTLGKANAGAVHHGANWQTFLVGLAFSITLSGLGWVENGNDYSRYLPRQSSRPAIVGWIFLGTAVPQVLIMLLGAAVASYSPSVGNNPIQDFPHAFSSWFLVPFLIVVIVQLFAINSLDLYSSGVTLQALGLRVKRWQAVLVDTVVACAITVYAVFSSSFNTLLSEFVGAVIVWIAPWMAIFLVDWALRRYRYVPAELQRSSAGGLYWYGGGVHWPAVIAQVAGGVAAFLCLNEAPHYVGPVARAVGGGGADFSIYAGVLVAGLVYFALGHRAVRHQGAFQDSLLAANGVPVPPSLPAS
ncbi:MAG: purine-cytosine permease family protein [Acidimicrobiales bacterium]